MNPSYIPTPGWVAAKLGGYGHEVLLSVYAAGVLEEVRRCNERGWPLGPNDTMAVFLELSADDDPLGTVTRYWREAIARFPYLDGHVGPLVDWLDAPPPDRMDAVRAIARTLSDIDFWGMNQVCRTNILASIHNELVAIAERRSIPTVYQPIWELAIDAARLQVLQNGAPLRPGQAVADLACAGGNRLVSLSIAAAAFGVDPNSLRYYAADYDQMALAVAGVNLASHGLTRVHLTSDLATRADWEGRIDLLWMDLAEIADRDSIAAADYIEGVVVDMERDRVREVLYEAALAIVDPPAPRQQLPRKRKKTHR